MKVKGLKFAFVWLTLVKEIDSIMVIVIKKDAPANAVDEALKLIASQPKKARKGFDPSKYAGKLKRGLDGMEYQKQARNKWN